MDSLKRLVTAAVLVAAGCGGGGGESRVGNASTNVAPVAQDSTFELDEDSGVFSGTMSASDANPSDTLFFNLAGDFTSGGTLTLSIGSNPQGQPQSNPAFTFEPRLNFNGTNSFIFSVNDGLASDQGTVTLVVRPVNDAPVAGDDSATTDIDVPVAIAVLDNDSDVDRDQITVVSVDAVTTAGGSALLNDAGTAADPTDDLVDYTPPAGFNGQDSFTYLVSDPDGETNAATVSVQVGPVVVARKLTVPVDLLPDVCPNQIGADAVGEIALAVLGSAALSVDSIDAASLRLAGVAPVRSTVADVAYLTGADPTACAAAAVDGYDDLVLVFPASPLIKGALRRPALELTGRARDGRPIAGVDRLTVISAD